MKQRMLTVLLLGFSFVLLAQKQNFKIGILIDNKTEKIEPILQELQTQIKVVVGEDATISFPPENVLINNYNLELAKQNYQQLVANETDIILAFGIINNMVVSEETSYPKPTILFGAVNKDLVNVDINKSTSGVNNFTYLIESKSYHNDLKKFKELTDFNNIGIIVERPLIDILPLKATFDKEIKGLDANYKLIPFETIEDITSNLKDIDAVYLAGGFFLEEQEIKQLANVFIDRKLPSFTSNNIEDVLNGFFATHQGSGDVGQFQRRIALNVEAYINGTNLSELPVFIESSPRLTINYNTAELVGVPIKYSLIGTSDFVGEFSNAISEKEYNLVTAIKQGLHQNLILAASEKDITLSKQDIELSKTNFLPHINSSIDAAYVDPDLAANSFGQNPEFSTSGNITLKQVIFSEGVRANIDIQKKLLKAQEETFNTNQLDIIYQIANIYFSTLILKANAKIRLRNLDLTKKNLQIAEQNFEAGQSSKSDVLRFRSEIAQNTQSMVEATNQLEQGLIRLNQLLNNPLEMEIDVEEVILDEGIFEQYNYNEVTDLLDNPKLRVPFIQFLVEEAKKNAPELKVMDYNLEVIERTKELYGKGRYLPTVGLQAEYNRTFTRAGAGSTAPQGFSLLDDSYFVGLNVSLPIFNQNINKINEQTAIVQQEQLMLGKENTKLNISANVRSDVLNLVNQISNIELSKISESTAEEALELIQTAYSSGAVNIIQLIDAQNNYLNAQLARNGAVYNFLNIALKLERSIGYFFLLNSKADNEAFKQRFYTLMSNKN